MAAIAKQTLTKTGAELTFAAASGGGDTIANPTSFDVLYVDNGSGAPIDVTIAVPGTEWNGVAKPDTVVTVPAGDLFAVKLDERYASSGVAAVTYSSATTVTVAVASH